MVNMVLTIQHVLKTYTWYMDEHRPHLHRSKLRKDSHNPGWLMGLLRQLEYRQSQQQGTVEENMSNG